MSGSLILIGFAASFAAGAASGLGALPVFVVQRITVAAQAVMLGFSAGVMLAASIFSLLLPALEVAGEDAGPHGAVLTVIAGFLLGAAALAALNRFAPHEHFIAGHHGVELSTIRRIWLFVIAITLHNFPEGLAVGVGFGGGDIANGTTLALGIGLQNLPEGLAVAVALLTLGYSRAQAVGVAFGTGLVEPVGGLLGVSAVAAMEHLLPWGLAFSAGAMVFVISNEMIPETHRQVTHGQGTTGLVLGFVLMMYLDVVLG